VVDSYLHVFLARALTLVVIVDSHALAASVLVGRTNVFQRSTEREAGVVGERETKRTSTTRRRRTTKIHVAAKRMRSDASHLPFPKNPDRRRLPK
jgi:hypothetical protein